MIINPFVDAILLLVMMSIAAELIAKGAEILEHKFGAGFVGSVVLGFITTFPELVFVIIAVLNVKYDVAIGSAIGGNILLFTFGYGAVIILTYVKHGEGINLKNIHIRDDLWYLLISCIAIVLFALDGIFQWWEGIILILFYVAYIVQQFFEARRYRIFPEEKEFVKEDLVTQKDWFKSGLFLIIGCIILLITAHPFVEAIGELSHEIGITALFLALVISPIASELPEKISAFIMTSKDLTGAEMSIANFIGSKVQNNSLLFGLMILIASWGVGIPITDSTKDILLLLVMTLTTILGVKLTYDLRLNPREGLFAIAMYVVAIALVFLINS